MRVAADDKFVHVSAHGPADPRIVLEYADGLHDFADARGTVLDFVLREMIDNTSEVFRDLGGELDSQHRTA
jgi:hypothetical protein